MEKARVKYPDGYIFLVLEKQETNNNTDLPALKKKLYILQGSLKV